MTNHIRRDKLKETQKHNRKIAIKITKAILCVSMVTGMCCYHINTVNNLKEQNETEIKLLEDKLNFEKNNTMAYKIMYDSMSTKINTYKSERDEAVNKYNDIQKQIKYSKLNSGTPSRGDYANKTLTEYPVVTVDEMNEFIEEVAPSDSPFIGRGETFLKASQITGLDPYYIFSHASVESGYGRSNIAITKNNYYGIAAFNHNPNNAYKMGNNVDEGIINGAIWIKNNYIDKGYNTLNKMVYEGKYCLTDDGEPSDKWVRDISSIATQNQ